MATEHSKANTRRTHFIGTSLLFVIIALAIILGRYSLLWFLPVVGYGFAWVGHFFIEKNKQATFQYPLFITEKIIIFGIILCFVLMSKYKPLNP